MNDVQTATKRTAWNSTISAAVLAAIVKWTKVELDENDLLLLVGALGVVAGVVYRTSRAITAKWPKVGYILFGSGKEPTDYVRQT
jgi:hypothetical protein